MEEFIKKVTEVAGNVMEKVDKLFEGINQKIFETTGTKVNVGFYVIVVVLIIFALVFAISILKWLTTLL